MINKYINDSGLDVDGVYFWEYMEFMDWKFQQTYVTEFDWQFLLRLVDEGHLGYPINLNPHNKLEVECFRVNKSEYLEKIKNGN